MFSVKELRGLASGLSRAEFARQLGPFALVQRPPGMTGSGTNKMGLPANVMRTQVARADKVTQGALGLLMQFDELLVATVPPLQGVDELLVGRQPDMDLLLDDPSVSKRHAVLRWDAASRRCSIEDLGSTNGTYLNAETRLKRETTLKNGDILSFGEVQYWFLLTDTLHERLTGAPTTRHSL
jgi:hypothetical protein